MSLLRDSGNQTNQSGMSAFSESDRHIIWSGIFVFNVVGLFGNLNVIYAHYRLKELRTKYGILLTMLVTAQSICLIYEMVGVVYGISGIPILRKSCFYLISPYVFTHCTQMALMAAIPTDLLISIVFPMRHRSVNVKQYLTVLLIPAILYGITVVVLGFIFAEDVEIMLCMPPLSLPFNVRRVWFLTGLVFNSITVISYLIAFSIIFCKYRTSYLENSDIERKAMKSLTVLILVFIFCRFINTFLANFLDLAGYSKDLIDRAQAFLAFPAMVCYSSTFYVCFVRSSEYRLIFWGQIVGMFGSCGIKLNKDLFAGSAANVQMVQPKRSTVSKSEGAANSSGM